MFFLADQTVVLCPVFMDFVEKIMEEIIFLGILRKENGQHSTFFILLPSSNNNCLIENPMSKTMRTVTMLLMSLLVMSCSVLTRNADDIIDDLRDARHAQYVNVGSGLLGLGRILSPTLSEASLGINSVQVLDLSKCSGNVRDKFRKHLQNLYKNRYYEELVTNQQGRDNLMVLARREGQYVTELVLANASVTTDALVVINGQINLENVERIINDRANYLIK